MSWDTEWRPFEPSRENVLTAELWSLLTCIDLDRAVDLDLIAMDRGTARKWSPTQTEECPIEDTLRGGYCETDEQLRERLRNRCL